MTAIQQVDNIEEAVEIIAEKISARKMRELVLKEAEEVIESGRKRKNTSRANWRNTGNSPPTKARSSY